MNSKSIVFALACLTALPVASYGQTSAGQPAATSAQQPAQSTASAWRKFRADYRERYQKLSDADKEKVKAIHQQIEALHQQEDQIVGVTPPLPASAQK
jgi:anti-sigma28 factor (negative regulator of flagellin synthesis)